MPHDLVLGPAQILRDAARRNWIASFPDRASVYRVLTQSVTLDGGHETIWYAAGSYPALSWSITGREALILGQLGVEGTTTLSLPYNADITEKDQVIYHSRETGVDTHLEVTTVHREARNQDVRCACIELKFSQPDMSLE